jgi:DNA-directed RNA polymerase subunit RPC12/RpoP
MQTVIRKCMECGEELGTFETEIDENLKSNKLLKNVSHGYCKYCRIRIHLDELFNGFDRLKRNNYSLYKSERKKLKEYIYKILDDKV